MSFNLYLCHREGEPALASPVTETTASDRGSFSFPLT